MRLPVSKNVFDLVLFESIQETPYIKYKDYGIIDIGIKYIGQNDFVMYAYEIRDCQNDELITFVVVGLSLNSFRYFVQTLSDLNDREYRLLDENAYNELGGDK